MNLHPYLHITLVTLLISPLVYAFFRLDHTSSLSFTYTFLMYVIILPIAFIMFNYLETGHIFKISNKCQQKKS